MVKSDHLKEHSLAWPDLDAVSQRCGGKAYVLQNPPHVPQLKVDNSTAETSARTEMPADGTAEYVSVHKRTFTGHRPLFEPALSGKA